MYSAQNFQNQLLGEFKIFSHLKVARNKKKKSNGKKNNTGYNFGQKQDF